VRPGISRTAREGDVVAPIGIKSAAGAAIMRHRRARARPAVQELHPDAENRHCRRSRMASTTTSTSASFFTQDLKDLELKMRQIIKQGQRFSRRVVSDDEVTS